MASLRPGDGHEHDPHRTADPRTVITDARESASDDLARRQKRYFIAMAFRVAFFIGMFIVPGWWRWVLLGMAAIIPTVAVAIANQADRRTPRTEPIVTGTPIAAPELPIAASDIIPGETYDAAGPVPAGRDDLRDRQGRRIDDRDGPAVSGAA